MIHVLRHAYLYYFNSMYSVAVYAVADVNLVIEDIPPLAHHPVASC